MRPGALRVPDPFVPLPYGVLMFQDNQCKACLGTGKSSVGGECYPCRGSGQQSSTLTWVPGHTGGLPVECKLSDLNEKDMRQLSWLMRGDYKEKTMQTNRLKTFDLIRFYMANQAGALAAFGSWVLEVGEPFLNTIPSPLPQYESLDDALCTLTEAAEMIASQVLVVSRYLAELEQREELAQKEVDAFRKQNAEKFQKGGTQNADAGMQLPQPPPGMAGGGGSGSGQASSPLSGLLRGGHGGPK